MKLFLTSALAALLLSGSAFAGSHCANDVPLKSLTAGFDAWKAVTDAMAACGNFEAELDQEFRTKQPDAFAADPALYQIGGVSASAIVPLLNAGTIRPLDDLIAKYGQGLKENQLIKINGQTMAIAMMVNNQHFMYRKDIFDDLGLAEPKTYIEVLDAAAAIKQAGVVDYPLGGTYQAGWNLAEEFVNLFLGFEGEFVDADNKPMVNNATGEATLKMMKALSGYMDPEFLVSDSTYVQQQFQQGKIAMANLWATRAGAMDNPDESQVVGKVKMSVAPMPAEGLLPASTLWWDGVVLAKNMTDDQADAAFRLLMVGLSRDMVEANNDAAVWIIDGYQPGPAAEGAVATANAGALPYPANTAMSIMHTALGNNIADYLTGKEEAAQTLADVEAEYLTAAKEAGLL